MCTTYKWVISVIGGAIAAFLGQYGIIVTLVAVSVIFDVVTGLIRAKATGEGLSSEKAHKGFWRKMSLFAAFFFGIFLDYAAAKRQIFTSVKISLKRARAFRMPKQVLKYRQIKAQTL